MKLPNCLKNLNSRKGNEKGSVTLFVLIAMLFFLMIGMMIFIINMNTETSQKRDVEKIKSEYSSGTSETDLEQMYQEAKARQLATFLIKLIDSNGNIYNSGEWINKKWLDENRMPLKIVPEFPAGVTNIDVTIIDETVAGRPSVHVKDTDELKRMTIGAANDKQYTIVNNVDTTNQIKVNIDTTLPTVTKPAGGTIWKGTEEETVTGTDAGGAVTITASDNLSGVKELKYIINNSPEAPSADAEWTTVEGATAQVTINNEKDLGVYYIHIIATDVAGNASEVVTSEPYYVKQANYKITTTTGTTYSETLKDAAEKPGAMVIKVLNTFTDDVAATIAQNVTIDTNGKTLTMAETITVASGATTTFVGTGTIQRNVADGVRGDLITNNGTVVVGVQNSETGPTLTSKDVVIKNGTVTVYSGIIASQGQSATVDNAGIYSGTINVYGGNITNDNGNYGIVVGNNGRCNISGGTVSGKMAICPQNGTLTVSESANIQGRLVGVTTSSDAHKYTLNMTGGTISSIRGRAIQSQTKVNITITGGTITGATEGINITGANSTLTIGNNSNALDRTAPVITGTTGTGINIDSATSTLNYYDGTIIGKTKGTKTFNGREVAFSVKDDTTVNFLTETEEGNVIRYYRPYTRQNTETNLFETVLEKQVNVTFNPGEGATVAESNRNVLTNVEYKEKAETAEIASLPTPEKTGYTFKGWNGKNLFKLKENVDWKYGDTTYNVNLSDNSIRINNGTYFKFVQYYLPVLKANTTYTISGKVELINRTSTFVRITKERAKDNGNTFLLNENLSNGYFSASFTIGNSDETTAALALFGNLNDGSGESGAIFSNIQLEQGSTATAYEPYYITDNTKVVQDQDHTLNAIWEANEYTVHFNGDGSTAGTVEDQKFKYDEEKALNENKFERKYTVTYDGNEGTSAKANDTATYTFANWGNKDILGYDLDFSEASKNTGTKYGKENGYTTISLDATEASSDKDMAKWTIQPQFNSGDRYKLTFYAKGNNLTTYFYGASNYLRVSKSESSQGVEHTANNNSTYSDGRIDFALTDEWTKYSVIYTLGSYGDRNVNKYVLFRVMHGNIASIYGVRFEKLENEEHQDKAVVKNLTSEPNGEVTLYAVWTPHEVTLPTATREGYIFNGWYDAAEGGNKIGDAGDKYIPEANTTLHAQWRQVHYTISVGEENLVAETLQEAIKLAEDRITGSATTATITATMNYNDNSTATISKDITIDTNGKTLTMANTIKVVANSTATFVDTGATKGKLERGTIATGAYGDLISNSGKVVVDGATIEGKDYVIRGGNVEIKSGTVDCKGSANRQDTKTIRADNIKISGGTITNNYSTDSYHIIDVKQKLEITGGTLTGGNYGIVPLEDAEVIISGGTINSDQYAIGSTHANTSIVINSGNITGNLNALSFSGENATITIGNNTNALNKELPVIQGTTGKGIVITGATSTLNYYDGKIIGKTKGTKTFNGREVAFSVKDDTTVNFLTETEAGNVTRYYRPYTRQNEETHLFETVLEKQVNVTFNPGEGATVAESNRNVLTNVEYKEKAEDATIVSLPTPTKTGYTFKGWNGKNLLNIDEATVRNNYNGTYGVNARVENDRIILSGTNNKTDKNYSLINWKTDLPQLEVGKTYNLSVSENLENVYVQLNYINTTGEDKRLVFTSSSEIVTIPNDYTKTNYLFIGIDKNATTVNYNFTVQLEEGSTATAYEPYYIVDKTKVVQDQDHTLKAIWEATPYTVTLNAGDGTIDAGDDGWARAGDNKTATKDITYDGTYGTLPTASRPGYEFDGWFTEATGGTQVKADTTMQTASEQTLYPHWKAITYKIKFNANGGTGTMADLDMTYDTAKNLTSNAFTKTGYHLKEWTTNADGTGTKFTDGQSVNNLTTTNGVTVNLYAQWEANEYTVSFDPNGGTPTPASKSVTYDSTYGTLPSAEDVSKTGYTFKGWNGKNLLNMTEWLDSFDSATNGTITKGENTITVSATENDAYTNSWLGGDAFRIKVKANTDYVISWKSDKNITAFVYIFMNGRSIDGYRFAANNASKKYLKFTTNSETEYITFRVGVSEKEKSITYSDIQLEEGTTATAYEPYYITAETKVTTASDHTLKAVWETIPYTISYELNKGTNNSSNPTGYTVESENITLQNPTRNGYTFIGWTGSNGDTPQTTVTIPKGSTGDRTYTANWEEKTYTLTIKPNGGALDGSTTDVVRNLKYSDVSNINDPTRTGYSFGGYNELSGAVYSNGLASVRRYSNSNPTQITIASQAKSADNPITGMSNELKITNSGTEETKPGLGGFLHSKIPVASAKYVHVFVAKLPEGYYFHNANNSLGTGATKEWLTSNEGTGKWQTYVYQVNAGSSGTFGDFGYVYVSTDKDNVLGGLGRAETGSYTAYLAYSNIYDITSDDSGIGQIDGTGVLTANWTANNYTITVDANGGTIPETEGWEGTGETATKQVTFDSQYGSLPTPTRAGYEFQGWKINGEGDLITNNSTVTTASNHTLKAVWKDIEKTKWTIKLHKPNPITPSVFQIFEN